MAFRQLWLPHSAQEGAHPVPLPARTPPVKILATPLTWPEQRSLMRLQANVDDVHTMW